MNPAILLMILRIVSALLLLVFIGLLAWLVTRDLAMASDALTADERPYGLLRVIMNEKPSPAVDSVFPLLTITSIGRAAGNTVVLSDGYASAEHALIMRRQGRWWLQDQGSRNGTLLNEVPVMETAVISAGDIISIGGTHLKVEF